MTGNRHAGAGERKAKRGSRKHRDRTTALRGYRPGAGTAVFTVAVAAGSAVLYGGVVACDRLMFGEGTHITWGLIATVVAGMGTATVVGVAGEIAIAAARRGSSGHENGSAGAELGVGVVGVVEGISR